MILIEAGNTSFDSTISNLTTCNLYRNITISIHSTLLHVHSAYIFGRLSWRDLVHAWTYRKPNRKKKRKNKEKRGREKKKEKRKRGGRKKKKKLTAISLCRLSLFQRLHFCIPPTSILFIFFFYSPPTTKFALALATLNKVAVGNILFFYFLFLFFSWVLSSRRWTAGLTAFSKTSLHLLNLPISFSVISRSDRDILVLIVKLSVDIKKTSNESSPFSQKDKQWIQSLLSKRPAMKPVLSL